MFNFIRLLCFILMSQVCLAEDFLTPIERQWLNEHKDNIVLAPTPSYSPFEYFDSEGKFNGICADFIQVVEKKLGIKFKVAQMASWSEVLRLAQEYKIDFTTAAQRTPEREAFWNFTRPYLTVQSVIVVRKEFKSNFNLSSLGGFHVGAAKGFAITAHVRKNYPRINLIEVLDERLALRMVSTGELDAAIIELPVALYFSKLDGLTNVRIAGDAEYSYSFGMAVRKDWPILQSILDKALAQIRNDEKEAIYEKWVPVAGYTSTNYNYILFGFGLLALIITSIAFWNWTLRREIKKRNSEIQKKYTELRLAEERRVKGEQLFEIIFETIPYTASIINLKNFHYLKVNKSYLNFYGLKKDEVLNISIFDRFGPDYRESILHLIDQVKSHNAISNYQIKVQTGKGERTILISAVQVFLKGEACCLFVSNDISDRVAMEKNLEENEHRYRTLFNSASDAILLSEGGIIKACNTKAQILFGCSEERMINRSVLEFSADTQSDGTSSREAMIKHLQSINTQSHDIIEWKHKKVDGTEFETEISLNNFTLSNTKQTIAIIRDISQRKLVEHELTQARQLAIQANEAKSIFLANMTHEMRTPLNSILGMIEILSETKLNSDQEQPLQIAQSNCEALLGIISDILDFSKIEKGEMIVENYPLDLRHLLDEVITMFTPRLRSKGLTFQLSIEKSLPQAIWGDTLRLRQILVNLITNAIKFTELGGIILKVTKESTTQIPCAIQFSLTDTGIGISEDKLPLLFNRFSQLDSSITKKYGGTGLGLCICKNLVELMHGNIQCQTEIGKGSTFIFTLPLKEASIESIPATKNEVHKILLNSSPEILVVDDSEDNIILTKKYLEKTSCKLDTAENGNQALQLIYKKRYNIILMDMAMPVMDGFTATVAIRLYEKENNLERTPIIALTAYALETEKAKALEAGCDLYVTKPIKKQKLLDIIADFTIK